MTRIYTSSGHILEFSVLLFCPLAALRKQLHTTAWMQEVGHAGAIAERTLRLFPRLASEQNSDAIKPQNMTARSIAERLDAFVSRFGRMQDTVGDKLIPCLLRSLAEKSGSALDNLNRAEKLGLLVSVVEWLDARNLRNKLVHEYMVDADEFAIALNQAHVAVALLVATYNAINLFAYSRIPVHVWPNLLPLDA